MDSGEVAFGPSCTWFIRGIQGFQIRIPTFVCKLHGSTFCHAARVTSKSRRTAACWRWNRSSGEGFGSPESGDGSGSFLWPQSRTRCRLRQEEWRLLLSLLLLLLAVVFAFSSLCVYWPSLLIYFVLLVLINIRTIDSSMRFVFHRHHHHHLLLLLSLTVIIDSPSLYSHYHYPSPASLSRNWAHYYHDHGSQYDCYSYCFFALSICLLGHWGSLLLLLCKRSSRSSSSKFMKCLMADVLPL